MAGCSSGQLPEVLPGSAETQRIFVIYIINKLIYYFCLIIYWPTTVGPSSAWIVRVSVGCDEYLSLRRASSSESEEVSGSDNVKCLP